MPNLTEQRSAFDQPRANKSELSQPREALRAEDESRLSRLHEDGSHTKAVYMNLAGTDILNQANERGSAKDSGGYTSGQAGFRQYSNQVPLIGHGTRPHFQQH